MKLSKACDKKTNIRCQKRQTHHSCSRLLHHMLIKQ